MKIFNFCQTDDLAIINGTKVRFVGFAIFIRYHQKYVSPLGYSVNDYPLPHRDNFNNDPNAINVAVCTPYYSDNANIMIHTYVHTSLPHVMNASDCLITAAKILERYHYNTPHWLRSVMMFTDDLGNYLLYFTTTNPSGISKFEDYDTTIENGAPASVDVSPYYCCIIAQE